MERRDRWPERDPYLVGLLLDGRHVVVVGGGTVTERRLPALQRAGARVSVVAPELTPNLRRAVARGELVWRRRAYSAGDLTGAWYVLAATDDARVNEAVAREAVAQQTFCVRADRADVGTAFTPATGRVEGTTVAVLDAAGPRRAAAVRDRLVQALSGLLGRDAA